MAHATFNPMTTKARPSVLAANAASIVDQAANTVVERADTFQLAKRPFSNRLVRILNSPELVRAPLSDGERVAVQAMLKESQQIQQRAQRQMRRQHRLQQRFEQDLRRLQDEAHREAETRAKLALDQRDQDRRRRAELALCNIAKRAQAKQEEKQQLRKAQELVRRSNQKPSTVSAPALEQTTPKPTPIDPRLRWKQFIRRYRKTRWLQALGQTLGGQKQEEVCARLLRRHDYGVAVRQQHVPVPSVKLQAELVARLEQLQHPAHIRQRRDVRALHPVVAGRPGTDKPEEPPPEPAVKRYANYLGGAERTRIGFDHLSRAELEQKVQALDRDIAETESGNGHRLRDVSPGRLAEQRARLSLLYVKALTAKVRLCDLYEAEQLLDV